MFRCIVDVVVDPDANGGVGVFCRRANQNPFRTRLTNMQFCLVPAGEKPSRLQHHVDPQILPRQIPRVPFLQNPNLVPAHYNVLLIVTDFAVKFPVDRVPLQ